MNKKGIIVLIVIIVLVVVGFLVWGGDDTSVVNNNTNEPSTNTEVPAGVDKEDFAPVTSATTDTSLLGRLKTVSVSAAETGTRVALVNGKASFTEGSVKGTITLGTVAVSKTISGVNHVLATLAVNSGTAATWNYVVLFEDKNGTLTDKSYAPIGDRVEITGVRADEVSDGKGGSQMVVSVSYKESGKARTKILVVENGVFNPAKEITI